MESPLSLLRNIRKREQKNILEIPIDDPDADFIKANIIIKLHSDLTGEDFYLCSTPELKNECRANDPDIVAYLPHEIRKLSGLKPEKVQSLHYARKIFGGEIIARNRVEDSIFIKQNVIAQGKSEGIFNPKLEKANGNTA